MLDDQESSQKQVNAAVAAVDEAIQAFISAQIRKGIKLNRIKPEEYTETMTSAVKSFDRLEGIITIQSDVMVEQTNSFWSLPRVYDSNNNRAAVVAFNNGNIQFNDGRSWQIAKPFNAGAWYNIEIKIDTTTKKTICI